MEHLDTERISAYIDSELSPGDMRQVEYHLMTCETCRREYDDLRGVATLVRELPIYLPRREITIPGDSAGGGSPTLARIIEFGKPLAVAAIVILVAFAALRLISGIGDDDSDDGDQISFSAVQETATVGTESTQAASDMSAAQESDTGAAGDEAEEDAAISQEAPAAAMPAQPSRMTAGEAPAALDDQASGQAAESAIASPQPTIQATPPPVPTAAPEVEADPEDTSSMVTAGIVIATVVVLAGAAAWYLLFRSQRRPRP